VANGLTWMKGASFHGVSADYLSVKNYYCDLEIPGEVVREFTNTRTFDFWPVMFDDDLMSGFLQLAQGPNRIEKILGFAGTDAVMGKECTNAILAKSMFTYQHHTGILLPVCH
jgi:hypothetical protein